MIRSSLAIIFCSVLAVSCKKGNIKTELPELDMKISSLYDTEVGYNNSIGVDLNRDGVTDVNLNTFLQGNPQMQALVFNARALSGTSLLQNGSSESPIFSRLQKITELLQDFQWSPSCTSELTRQVKNVQGDASWEGVYKKAFHQFLPVLVKKDDRKYFGWIEVSVDQDKEKLIAHRCGISVTPGIPVLIK